MNIGNVISIVAVIIAPVIAVWVGQKLQEKAQKRQDKMLIFKTLMASRAYWSYDAVIALNIIEVAFNDNKEVIMQWRKYYEKLCIENHTNMEAKAIQDEKNKLLEIMAYSLGYKDNIKWDIIENPYMPKGILDEMERNQKIQSSQQELMNKILDNCKVQS